MIRAWKMMTNIFKDTLKHFFKYNPLPETAAVRDVISRKEDIKPLTCPFHEGDFLYLLIRNNKFRDCLETGFKTGSTALYMAFAVAKEKGSVTSICMDEPETVKIGLSLLADLDCLRFHTLINKNSNTALPELFYSRKNFDLVYVDGWKTFDHLVMEIYFINQMLKKGGIIVLDDSHMPSVRKVILILLRYYNYKEISYVDYNQSYRLRASFVFQVQSIYAPYRAFEKTQNIDEQLPFKNWNFFRGI